MPELIVEDICLRYGAVTVLKGASFSVERGEIAALLGASGSGKTTLLRTIAGLERAYQGKVEISGKPVFDGAKKLDLPAEKRGLGFVFQSYALWPNRTVFQNVAYGLKLRKTSDAEIRKKVGNALDALGLGHLGDRYPGQLSGGQQQRVAIARSLVYDPAVILLDEPLSNLDAKLRDEARAFLKELIKREERAAVIVTHDQVEALAVADLIVLLNGGVIEQAGTPEELYKNPKTLFTADFIGNNIKLQGKVAKKDKTTAVINCGDFTIQGQCAVDKSEGDDATAVCRLNFLTIGEKGDSECVEMDRVTSMFLGEYWEHIFRHKNIDLRVQTTEDISQKTAFIKIPHQHVWIF
ncbi:MULTISPECIES: ABC transporter ATP-binding protein [Bartonella]|uniref:ABC transporter ATP-binding protein n=1 Tax=Bartonella TaxID=773 RepID=UPI00098FFC7B|nr:MULTISPECIES: ABC transporter ATP-binding protein [Bartonella]AQT44159.1 iron(III) transport system ATP-binding protein [Bartonella apihabitans]MBH9995108.1 ABC transporter ATP-binding protein [Bartonella sp. P0291]MBH9996547.1 ABC transporter ATP-binding protein [Bartonella sp. M0192]MBH9998707.1 ABC transporter ATP-binding protein [Bartonella sp. M0191]MBI0008943.1 ABC transporter ATP-binding protein [Bartonella sp. M0193]